MYPFIPVQIVLCRTAVRLPAPPSDEEMIQECLAQSNEAPTRFHLRQTGRNPEQVTKYPKQFQTRSQTSSKQGPSKFPQVPKQFQQSFRQFQTRTHMFKTIKHSAKHVSNKFQQRLHTVSN